MALTPVREAAQKRKAHLLEVVPSSRSRDPRTSAMHASVGGTLPCQATAASVGVADRAPAPGPGLPWPDLPLGRTPLIIKACTYDARRGKMRRPSSPSTGCSCPAIATSRWLLTASLPWKATPPITFSWRTSTARCRVRLFSTICLDPMYGFQPFGVVEERDRQSRGAWRWIGRCLDGRNRAGSPRRSVHQADAAQLSIAVRCPSVFLRIGFDGERKRGFVKYLNRARSSSV